MLVLGPSLITFAQEERFAAVRATNLHFNLGGSFDRRFRECSPRRVCRLGTSCLFAGFRRLIDEEARQGNGDSRLLPPFGLYGGSQLAIADYRSIVPQPQHRA